jgi:hypothetical protein
MAWTSISNALVAVGALPFATTIQALRDNPIAIANGDAGAPRITDGALSTSVTGAGTSWVGARSAGLAAGAVGTYAMLKIAVESSTNEGGTRAGSELRYTDGTGILTGGTPSGTWRAMGRASSTISGGSDPEATVRPTTWLRIS